MLNSKVCLITRVYSTMLTYLVPKLVLGDNVSIKISIISVLLSRYDNYHDNYMKGVHEHTKKSVHLHIIMQNRFSGSSMFLLLVSTLPAVENTSSVSHSSPMTSYQYRKHTE